MEDATWQILNALVDLSEDAYRLTVSALHAPPWKLAAALVLGVAGSAAVSALPEEGRGSAGSIVLIAFGLSVIVALFAPFDWDYIFG